MVMDGVARNAIKVDGRELTFAAPLIDLTDVAALAGLLPPDAYVFVRIDDGVATQIEPGSAIELGTPVPRLRSGRIVSAWGLAVDGRRWDWIAPGILDTEVREIAGIAESQPIFVAGLAEPVRPGGLIDLTGGSVQVTTRRHVPALRPVGVPVIVNGRRRELADPDATFEDLVKLAFPQLPVLAERTFTVTYRRGGAARPEGSLVPHQAARLAPGAVINVSATDKS